MLPLRSACVIRRGVASQHAACLGNCSAAGSRAFLRRHTARPRLSERVSLSGSRVQATSSNSLWPCHDANIRAAFKDRAAPAHTPAAPLCLKSAFPKKTVLVLLALGGLVYYFGDTAVDLGDNFYTDMQFSYEPEYVHPFVSNHDKQSLDDWIMHIPDSDPGVRTADVYDLISENFEKLIGGWMMTSDDARRQNLPVTHGCRHQSNMPCEDYHALGTNPGPGEEHWNYWSIMDGHAGRFTAAELQLRLIPYLSSALLKLPTSASSWEIETTIKQTFLAIDKSLMDRGSILGKWFPAGHVAAIEALAPALSGSCALLATFDPKKDILRVACTGDSRAVLGRWDPSTKSYTCIPLSEDQTGFNEKEVARLTKEHPDEPDMINPKSGRLLGLAVTRAFGDHRWKWDNDFIKAIQYKFWGSSPRPNNKTPPYLTAEPEITETKIVRADPEARCSDFMIMASDGLWDRISSEHAVECVERWLEAKHRGRGSVARDAQRLAQPTKHPTTNVLEDGIECDPETGKEIDWKATPEYFAIEDENAATCLARNAMGGTRRNLFTGVMVVSTPFCRNAVDDTTIMVVFFDKWGEQDEGLKMPDEPKKSWWKPW